MSRGVRLSSLTISAFRGIGERLAFDLRAPLTLVFAPNGTGKTTMCEAAEWLLTGQVDRLKDKKDFDAVVLRSKFVGHDRDPYVVADVRVGKATFRLTRTAEGSQSTATFEVEGSAVPQRPSELLALLASAAAATDAHHLTAISLRQRWLKGTRFLSAEALAALVDTDDETIERRKQVFADLLGIRHLLDAERQLGRYASELSSRLRVLEQGIRQNEAEASALGKELEDADDTTSAQREAAQAELLLNPETDASTSSAGLPDRLDALTASHRRSQHENGRRLRAAGEVSVRLANRAALEQALAAATELEAKLDADLRETEKAGQAAASKVIAGESERQSVASASKDLATAGDGLSRRSEALLYLVQRSPVPETLAETLGALRNKLPEVAWTPVARGNRLILLGELASGTDQALREADRLRLLDVERTSASGAMVSEVQLAALRTEANESERRAAEASRVRDAVTAPVVRLQAAARDLLSQEHSGDASTCPVCAHDWQSAAALHSAIEKALASAPELSSQAEGLASAAMEAARIARAKLDLAQAANARLVALDAERLALVDVAERRRLSLESAGLPISVTADELRSESVRCELAEALAMLDDEISAARSSVPSATIPFLPDDTPLSGMVEQVAATIAEQGGIFQLRLAELARDVVDMAAERDRIRAKHAKLQESLRSCREAIAAKARDLEELQAYWEIVAPERPWSATAFAAASAALRNDQERLARAEAHIEAARAAWSVESRRTRMIALLDAIKPARAQQTRMSARIAAAARAQAVFREAYIATSTRQVQDLANVVNPLFARMHANRVYDRIDLGEDGDFLRWLAHAGDAKLDPGKDFSQGQRQDLALALFLARARGLGGTFFLDEPVGHLDDLNRVGLLDILRATVIEASGSLNLVITTSSRALARHLIEKFAGVGAVMTPEGEMSPLRVIELDGNIRSGIELRNVYPLP